MDKKTHLKEFFSGQEITMKMTLTPEQYSFFEEWSAQIPTLYMLDICVVSATKLSEESLIKEPRKARLVNKLHYLDRDNNCFSYLCALMEKVSDSRGILTSDELEKQILSDLSAMRKFFKNAHVYEPDDFVIAFLKELKGEPIEDKRKEYLEFLEILNNQFKLQNPISPNNRLAKAKEIIQSANDLNIDMHHPIITIALACLYQNPDAQKLMKFKMDPNKFDAENALSDIVLISRFAKLKLEIEHYGRNGVGYYARTNFITDDNGLSKIIQYFKPQVLKYKDKIDGRESQLTMTIKLKEILTKITENEYKIISDLLLSKE